jgi:diguanylate cyclase (GGDEF)-like protein/PAS domain S-box-containing protein
MWDSLQIRYLLAAGVFSVFLIAVAVLSSRLITEAATNIESNASNHQKVRETLRSMGVELRLAEFGLREFLVIPSRANRLRVSSMFQSIGSATGELIQLPWVESRPEAVAQAQQLGRQLAELRRETSRLMDVRADSEKLYPATDILTSELLPANQAFQAAVNVAINEAKIFSGDPDQQKLYVLFDETRDNWERMISSWRLVIANRSGVFTNAEEGMRAQEENVEMYADTVRQYLAMLSPFLQRETLGFSQRESINAMVASYERWRKSQRKAMRVLTSTNWRRDIPLLQQVVNPMWLQVWSSLNALERAVIDSTDTDTGRLADTASRIVYIVWLVALVGIAVTVSGYLLLEILIRRPLQRLIEVFRAEAAGPGNAPLPRSGVSETRELVESFDEMRNQVHSREKRLVAIVDNTAEAIVTVDASGLIESFNSAAETLFGYLAKEVLGRNLEILLPALVTTTASVDGAARVVNTARWNRDDEHELEAVHAQGHRIPVSLKLSEWESDARTYYTALIADIRERKAMVDHLKQMAEHDGLTGLYNRSYFQTELERITDQIGRSEGRVCGLLYIDLDNFKYVNDTMGHATGDRLLMEVAGLIAARTRKADIVARFGGDEFTILLPDIDLQRTLLVAEDFRNLLVTHPFKTKGIQVDIGCSIGITMISHDNCGPDTALAQADLACHLAKRGGRNRVHIYEKENESDVNVMSLDMGWSRRIKTALERDGFLIALQPVMAIQGTQVLTYSEALVRMRDETGEPLLPGTFLASAERFGLSTSIDRWVIGHAIALLGEKRREDSCARFGINLSGTTLADADICNVIESGLRRAGLDPAALIFEVTETLAMADMPAALEILTRLKEIGCQTALDDFGTGMSSFAYLRDLPVDIIKIDGRFIRTLCQNEVDQAMVRAITDIAHALGKLTIAEYVEDATTLALLKTLGVDCAQGFYFGKPVLTSPRATGG